MKCPHCGKELNLTPLQDLRRHIEENLLKVTAKARGAHTPLMEKWQSWLNLVKEMEKSE